MKKLFITLTAVALMGATAKVWAGCGGCEGHKPKAAAMEANCAASDCFAKMDLTDDQKTKIAEVRKECAKATSKEECRKVCAASFVKILTADQYKQWEEATAGCAATKGGCPFSKAADKPAAAAGEESGHKGCSGH